MVRAAAKNFDSVAVVTDPERYGFLLDELRSGGGELSPDTRRELAAEAFAHTAGYDAAISEWFSETEPFPDRVVLDLVKAGDLAYGENPHQRAAFYVEAGARRHLLSMIEQLGGPPLSFNNLWDLQAARGIAGSFQLPGLRDRQARDALRRGRRCHHRGGVRARAGGRPGGRVRRGDRGQPAGQRRAGRAAGRPGRARAVRPGLRAAGGGAAAPAAQPAHPRGSRAAQGQPRRARHEAGAGRPADPGSRHRDRRPRHHAGGVADAAPASRSGAICCSPGASASTSARTRS